MSLVTANNVEDARTPAGTAGSDPAKTADRRNQASASLGLDNKAISRMAAPKCKTQSRLCTKAPSDMSDILIYTQGDPAEPMRRGYFSVFMPECDGLTQNGKGLSWL